MCSLLQIEDTPQEVVATLCVDRLTEANAAALSEPLFSLLTQLAGRPLRLNLAAVRFVGTTGLALLFSLHQKIRAQGGHLTLIRVHPQVCELFETTRLHDVFDIRKASEPGEIITSER